VASFTAGQVVLLPFPFSDLSRSKLRPVLFLAGVGNADWVGCQITSNPYGDPRAIELTQSSFASGSLNRTSYVRPGKLFTAHESLVSSAVGILKSDALQIVREAVTAVVLGK
jgi:mRNA interferase MazF